MNFKRLIGLKSQHSEVKINPAYLRLFMMQVHRNQNHIAFLSIRLAVADQEGLIGRMEPQTLIAVQRLVRPSNFIHPCNQRLQVLRLVNIPMAQLIFLRVEILLAARLNRPVFA